MSTFIDFEDLKNGTVVVDQYEPRGVRVWPAVIEQGPATPHSGINYLRTVRSEFAQIYPFSLYFVRGQKHVRLFAGAVGPNGQVLPNDSTVIGVLYALDSTANTVSKDGPKFLAVNACSTMFEVAALPNLIHEVRLESFQVDFSGVPTDTEKVIDDVEFDAEVSPATNVVRPPLSLHQGVSYSVTLGATGWVWTNNGPVPLPVNPLQFLADGETQAFLVGLLTAELAKQIDRVELSDQVRRFGMQLVQQEAQRILATM
jgi:hypothetical protein